MGQWETERGRGSDAMADILGEALRQIGLLRDEYSLLDPAVATEVRNHPRLCYVYLDHVFAHDDPKI